MLAPINLWTQSARPQSDEIILEIRITDNKTYIYIHWELTYESGEPHRPLFCRLHPSQPQPGWWGSDTSATARWSPLKINIAPWFWSTRVCINSPSPNCDWTHAPTSRSSCLRRGRGGPEDHSESGKTLLHFLPTLARSSISMNMQSQLSHSYLASHSVSWCSTRVLLPCKLESNIRKGDAGWWLRCWASRKVTASWGPQWGKGIWQRLQWQMSKACKLYNHQGQWTSF